MSIFLLLKSKTDPANMFKLYEMNGTYHDKNGDV